MMKKMEKNTSKKTNLKTNTDEVSQDQIVFLLKEILAEIKKLKKQNMSAEELFGK